MLTALSRAQPIKGGTVINFNIPAWPLTEELTQFIFTTFFKQSRPDSSALVHGRLPGGQVYAWLYTADHDYSISLEDHDKFKQASKSRGGFYSIEICEFMIEEVQADGDLVLNHWRRTRDDTGEGGRVVLSRRHNTWMVAQRLTGWRSRPSGK